MTQPNRDMSELEQTLKEYGDGSLVNDIGFIQYLIDEARQKAFSAGEAHGAVKERGKIRGYITKYHTNLSGEFGKPITNDYVKGGVRVLTLVARHLDKLEALQGEKKESRDR